MVPWWKRLLYSLASVAIPPTAVFLCFLLWVHLRGARDFWLGFGCTLYFNFSLIGWVLAVPFALIVTDIQGWRMALWAGVGALLGPVLIGDLWLLGPLSPPSAVSAVLSAAASALATLIYLLLMRRDQRRASLMRTKSGLAGYPRHPTF
jgi:hypothetical protein